MSETLRPSTLGEILDRTAQLYRRNFWLFAGVAALPIGAIIAISALAGGLIFALPGVKSGYSTAPVIPILAVALLVLLVVPVYITAAIYSYAGLTEAAAGAYRGEKITIRGALKSVRPRFWRYLWFMILQGILVALIPGAIAGAMIAPLIYMAFKAGGDPAAGIAFGFLAFLIGAAALVVITWRGLGYSLSLAVCVVEKKPAWGSLTRGWNLSQGTRGRIFVMILLVIALGHRRVDDRRHPKPDRDWCDCRAGQRRRAIVDGVCRGRSGEGDRGFRSAGASRPHLVDRAGALLLRPTHPQGRLRHRVDDAAGWPRAAAGRKRICGAGVRPWAFAACVRGAIVVRCAGDFRAGCAS